MSKMGVEARTLLDEEDQKFDGLSYARRTKKASRLRSWIYTIATHSTVALLVVVLFKYLPTSRAVLRGDIWTANVHPTLYCRWCGTMLFSEHGLTENPAPLKPAIKYKIDHPTRDAWSNHLYFGPPSDDSERAWNAMIYRMTCGKTHEQDTKFTNAH